MAFLDDFLKFFPPTALPYRGAMAAFKGLFPGAPDSEELTPDLEELRALLAQMQDPDFIRNQVAEMFAKIPDTSTDFLQRVRASGGSSAQASEQAQAANTQRNQSAIDLSNQLIQGGRQNALQGLFGVAGIEQQGLLGAAGFDQDRTQSIQSFINSILSGVGSVAGGAAGGGGRTVTSSGQPQSFNTSTSFNPDFQRGFFPTQSFGNDRVVTPGEQLGGAFGGTQGIGNITDFSSFGQVSPSLFGNTNFTPSFGR